MRKKLLVVLFSVVIGMLFIATSVGAATKERLSEHVTLQRSPGPKDPYTLFFDIKVKSPGVIRMGVDVQSLIPSKDSPRKLVGISLLEKDGMKTLRSGVFSENGGKLEYAADALDLERTNGDFRILVSNFSRKHVVKAHIAALYPGEANNDETAPSASEHLFDLAIGEISLDAKGCIAVEIVNAGTSPLPLAIWADKSPDSLSVLLEIDDKSWGGAAIWSIDPQRTLQRPGSRIVYHSTYRVTKPVKVTAIVDKTRRLREQDERNNIKRVTVQP